MAPKACFKKVSLSLKSVNRIEFADKYWQNISKLSAANRRGPLTKSCLWLIIRITKQGTVSRTSQIIFKPVRFCFYDIFLKINTILTLKFHNYNTKSNRIFDRGFVVFSKHENFTFNFHGQDCEKKSVIFLIYLLQICWNFNL